MSDKFIDPLTGKEAEIISNPAQWADAIQEFIDSETAKLGKPREYHEPFILLPPESMPELRAAAIKMCAAWGIKIS